MASAPAIQLPPENENWLVNNAKGWRNITYEDLVDYLVSSKAYDGKAMKSFRSLYAYNYVQNGWLGDIFSYTCNDIQYLKAKVSSSQPGVGRADYMALVAVDEDCSVVSGHCTCPAGEGRSCSHISAIIYAVSLAWKHGIAGETCTDKKRLWGRGAGKAVLQERFENIDFNRPKLDEAPVEKDIPNKTPSRFPVIPQYLDHSDLVKHANESCTSILWTCKGTMLHKIINAKEKAITESAPVSHSCHEINEKEPVNIVQCQPCNDFYQKYINLSEDAKINISKATVSQSSTLWHDVRKLRIPSSKANSVPKTRSADPQRFVINHIYLRFKGNTATQHGLKHEVDARTWFQATTGHKVEQIGIIIDKKEPYLAASPDGLVDEDTTLEIKCLTKPLSDLISGGKYDIVCTDGVHKLNPKGRNGYYTQVQMAMHCSGRTKCKFLAWTKEQSILLDIEYDQVFVTEILQRIRKFYFTHLLVRLVEECHFKRLKLCDQYKQFCLC